MNTSITCDQCGKKYSVADDLVGKRVKCRQCGSAFVVPAVQSPVVQDPLVPNPLAPADVGGISPVDPTGKALQSAPRAAAPHHVGGPTDKQMRIGAAICLPLMLVGIVLCMVTDQGSGMARAVVPGLGPLAMAYSIAALIDPNIVRAAGKFGSHLSFRYKLVATLIGVVGLACGLILVSFLLLR